MYDYRDSGYISEDELALVLGVCDYKLCFSINFIAYSFNSECSDCQMNEPGMD